MRSGESIDEIILRHSTRGMDILQKFYPVEHCKIAVENFLKLGKGTVFLYTGFYVGGHAETDGPIGTYFLAKALNILGYRSIIVTDSFCENFFKDIECLYIPMQGFSEEENLNIINKYNPVSHISIERCGKNSNGKYANMRGKDIGEFTAPVDDLFTLGGKIVPSFAIGDGGNEIGMGNFKKNIENDLSLVPCIVECNYPIIASVSNWGAYGFIAYLESILDENVLPSFDDVDRYLEYIVSLGSVDGVKSENVKSVDGKDWSLEKEILIDLKTASINHHNFFTMSETYHENSKSQINIGTQLIDKLIPFLEKNTTVLDIGCGPGNLTYQLHKKSDNNNIVSGMDIDNGVIKQAQNSFPKINFFIGSFFTKNLPKAYDYIFSNEAIHWTPQIPEEFFNQDGIIYYFFDNEYNIKYREWGLDNLKKTFEFISRNMNKKAIVQFGLDGQLHSVYEIINEVSRKLFPQKLNSIKFPLFYPTFVEVETLIDNTDGISLIKYELETVDLVENNTEEVLGFIKGFADNYLRNVLSSEELELFYSDLLNKIENNFDKMVRNQWKHCILILEKN